MHEGGEFVGEIAGPAKRHVLSHIYILGGNHSPALGTDWCRHGGREALRFARRRRRAELLRAWFVRSGLDSFRSATSSTCLVEWRLAEAHAWEVFVKRRRERLHRQSAFQ